MTKIIQMFTKEINRRYSMHFSHSEQGIKDARMKKINGNYWSRLKYEQ